jgi:hypothetical protein
MSFTFLAGAGEATNPVWSSDGQRFYATQDRTPSPPRVVTHINIIQNWFEELCGEWAFRGSPLLCPL